jgi:DNA-binding CsgD family transcriptional regulator
MPVGDQAFSENEVRRLLGLCRRLALAGSEVSARKQLFLSELCRLVGAVAGLTAMLADDFSVQGELTVVRIDPNYAQQENSIDEYAAVTTIAMNESGASAPQFKGGSIAIGGADVANGDDAATAVLAGHGRDVFGSANPLINPLIREAASRMFEPTAMARSEAVNDQDWYNSEFYRQCRVPFGLDDCILSVVPLPNMQPFINVVCLSGPLREDVGGDSSGPPEPFFSARQRRIVEFAHSELRWIHYTPERTEAARLLAEATPEVGMEAVSGRNLDDISGQISIESAPAQTALAPVGAQLSPRHQRVLSHLLTGVSEKEIAGELGLSRHTVHEYVRTLYRQFNVTSRGELMARCLRTQPA